MADLSTLHPVFRQRVEATGASVLSAGRSTTRQAELYDGWVRGLPGYNPANPPNTSWHEYGEGLTGGRWTLAVDFNPPYPHGAAGLCFPIPSEPWHAQPSEVTEVRRAAGAELRLPPVDPVVAPPADPYDLKGRTMLVLDSSLKTYGIFTHAGKAVDVTGIRVEDRTRLQQYAWNGGKNQRFYVDPCGADVYRIIAAHSGRVLDLAGPDGMGAAVWQFAWAAAPNQMWRFEEVPGGFIIASQWDRGLVLDVEGASSDDGAAIIVWERTGGVNQVFALRE